MLALAKKFFSKEKMPPAEESAPPTPPVEPMEPMEPVAPVATPEEPAPIAPPPPLAINEQLVTFFDTFGFVKLDGYLKDEIAAISDEFDRMMAERFGSIEPTRTYFYPQFADSSPMLAALLESPKIIELAAALCGEHYLYKGSDGSIVLDSANWHRDYLLRVKSIKMLTYLEHNDKTSGALNVLPGSHFLNDAYSGHLTHSLTWPEHPAAGGFDEKGFLPPGNSPRIPGHNVHIPYVTLETKPGDVIVFNHNIVHCANMPNPPKRRRFFGLHFCADLAKEVPGPESEREMEEIRALCVSEMKEFSLANFYGPALLAMQSPAILRQTAMLRALSLQKEAGESGGQFNGIFRDNSDQALDFHRINRKNGRHPRFRFAN